MPKRTRSDHDLLKQELQSLVRALEAAGRASLPPANDALLRSIVEAAARIFQAAAASILLINETDKVLEFRVAAGAANRDLVGLRFPLDQGVAGYVAMTGQPIAVSDVAQDPRFHRDFAQSTGYVPRCILATPLISDERILGVMEVLDKIDAPSFGMQDMELLGIFAGQAALAIEMSQGLERLGDALAAGLKRIALSNGVSPSGELAAILDAPPGELTGSENDLLQLADLLNEFSRLGEEERRTGLKVLTAFAEYGRSLRRAGPAAGRQGAHRR